jgi:cyclophilin family peptidyl-prolyl cis-trans isomerase
MGKRAQEKRQRKEQDTFNPDRHIFNWHVFTHWQFWVAALAFILVVGYPFFTSSYWYQKNIKKLGSEDLLIQTAKQATIKTDKGEIVFSFEKDAAPKTSENFIRLASRGYYNGLSFHRVEAGFVIQGGDPKGDGTGGESAWGGTFVDEINSGSPIYQKGYVEGTVAMANSGPNTNGSQFFITLADQPNLPASYTIFGHVTSGMDVVKNIAKGDKMNLVEVK